MMTWRARDDDGCRGGEVGEAPSSRELWFGSGNELKKFESKYPSHWLEAAIYRGAGYCRFTNYCPWAGTIISLLITEIWFPTGS